jgi:hypothetical protein
MAQDPGPRTQATGVWPPREVGRLSVSGDVRQLDSDELAGIYELMLINGESEGRTVDLFKAE